MRPLAIALTLGFATVLSLPHGLHAQSAEAEVIATVDRFHAALETGDSTTVLELLADDVVILESGGSEDKEHYRSGHLAADMRYAQAVDTDADPIRVTLMGDVAWAWTTKTVQGRMGDREIDSRSAELMVLARLGGEWIVKAIHWSSR